MNDEIQKSYFATIPATVRYDKELTPNAKLLYGEITALTNAKGFCWATNNYFSELYNVSKTSISKWINQLQKRGHVDIKINYKKNSKEIESRHIYIDNQFNTYERKVGNPIKEKFNTPIKEKFKDNNTSINNTSEYKEKNKKETYFDLINNFTDNKLLQQAINDWIEMRTLKKAKLTNTALQKTLDKIKTMVREDDINRENTMIAIFDQSTMNSWTGIFPLRKNDDNNKNDQKGNKYRHIPQHVNPFNDKEVDEYFASIGE
ncbi:MAG: helix-turn-helix domain-containing protein [Nitrosopumilales archaeon]|nr:MAG: helix-turn-helix domain-containing protein [Nitrosopumilales archaeon]RPJ31559.1 MAG: helix-turn-helix domain-containing protein [Nitrosopumilales archaeon]